MRTIADAEDVRGSLSNSEWGVYLTLRVGASSSGQLEASLSEIARTADVRLRAVPYRLEALRHRDLISVAPVSPDSVRITIH